MDEQQLQTKIEEAKAAGYTDAEIQAHINDMRGTPTPLEAPEQNKHHEANVGAAQLGALAGAEQIGEVGKKALEYGIPAYGLYKGGQAIANRMPGPVAPQAPTTFTGGANPAFDAALSQPHPSTVPQQPPTAQNFIQRIAELSSRYAPAVRGVGGVAAAVTPGNALANYGAHFPQTGPARGMEINPQTGRPWTEIELSRYNQQY